MGRDAARSVVRALCAGLIAFLFPAVAPSLLPTQDAGSGSEHALAPSLAHSLAHPLAHLLPSGDAHALSRSKRKANPPEDASEMNVPEAFRAARKAMQDIDLKRFDEVAAIIPKQHLLHDYIEYWRLRIRLNERFPELDVPGLDAEVQRILRERPALLSTDLLRRDWILSLARRNEWDAVSRQYDAWVLKDENGPRCANQLAQQSRGRVDLAVSRGLLGQAIELHKLCDQLFTTLADTKQIDANAIRQRLRLAMEANDGESIRDASLRMADVAGLDDAEARVDRAMKSPEKYLARDAHRSRTLALVAVVRWARGEPDDAAGWLQSPAPKASGLSAEDIVFAWSQVAAAGARRLAPQTHEWAKAGAKAEVSDDTRFWLLRAALKAQDWPMVLDQVERLDEVDRRDSAWSYWKARALKALQRGPEADAIFGELLTRQDFYGKLAAEELGRPIVAPRTPAKPPAEQIAAFDANPGFERAQAFYVNGMRYEGNREWNFQLRSMDEPQVRAAAWWAYERKLLDRAINTDERLGNDANYELRFPTPFVRELTPFAKHNALDIAWVYGLIRQESRFVQDAQSHVGASGLMQMMPATGRWVARRLGRSRFDASELNDLSTNLEFGTYYLKSVLDDLDGSAVLATAGYNAGPRRSKVWRASLEGPLEGAIFAELIPFAETRGYVKNVMSNAVDYASMLTGEPQSLKARLGIIDPRGSTETTLP